MREYRERSSGDIFTDKEVRQKYRNVSFAATTFDDLGFDPIFHTPQPAPSGDLKVVYRDGEAQDENGNWVEKWSEKDRFSGPDKAAQEAAYLDDLKDQKIQQVVNEMVAHQDGGTTIDGVFVHTDPESIANASMVKIQGDANRKVVSREDGATSQISKADGEALYKSIAEFRQRIEDHAYDLIQKIEAGDDVVIEGWPE